MRFYTGIGSRTTPPEILAAFERLGFWLARDGWTLRSGAAPGADSAFERGARDYTTIAPHIYLPWAGFEKRRPEDVRLTAPASTAYRIAAQFHPAWERLSDGAQSLHARNTHQIVGDDPESPLLSAFVVCWTPEGSGAGGTGQALRLATHYGIRIVDCGRDSDYATIIAYLNRKGA
jgi:hypothetical protein